MHPRPCRFGTILQVADSKEEWRGKARQVEDLGYAVLRVPDHIGSQPDALKQLAPIPALIAAADATSSIHLGIFVFDNNFRHPVIRASEAATLDVLPEGRCYLNILASWLQEKQHQISSPLAR